MQFASGPDAQSKPGDVRLQHYAANNSQAATAKTPDDILAMIFETCMQLEHDPENEHYGDLVSHISRRWRTVALATPGLWTQIRYYDYPSKTPMDRVTTYLLRSKRAPVDIHVEMLDVNWDQHLPPALFRSIIDHIDHCRQLCFVNVTGDSLKGFFGEGALQPEASLLRSFQISGYKMYTNDLSPGSGSTIGFRAPRLRIMRLDNSALSDVLNVFHISADSFKSVTHLRLDDIFIDRLQIGYFDDYKRCFTAMQSLTHLELKVGQMVDYLDEYAIVLPGLQFLHIEFLDVTFTLTNTIKIFQAPSLQTLSLTGRQAGVGLNVIILPISHFPLLRHIILHGYLSNQLGELEVLAETFPSTERLTFKALRSPAPEDVEDIPLDIEDVLLAIVTPLHYFRDPAGKSVNWHKLQSITVSTSQAPLDGELLRGIIHDWQKSEHPLKKIVVPNSCVAQADAAGMVELRKLIDIEDFIAEAPVLIEDMY